MCTVLLMALALSANAQSPHGKLSDGVTAVAKTVDPKLHADAVKLVEFSGAKKHLQDSFEKAVDDGAPGMMEKWQGCAPEFGKEWKKPQSLVGRLTGHVPCQSA